MAGTFFEYFDGYVRVAYARAWSGDIFIDFWLFGDTVVATPCNDAFEKGEPEVANRKDVTVRTWTSSAVSYFFADLVCWLEAVVCGVRECAFNWEGEGPDGELRWRYNGRDSGSFSLAWSGTSRSPAAQWRVRVNRVQLVRAFYESFRQFVESDRYDPLVGQRLGHLGQPDASASPRRRGLHMRHRYRFGEKLRALRSPRVERWLANRDGPLD